MSQLYNKFIKIFIPIVLLALLIINVLIASATLFPETTGVTLSKIGFFDLLFGNEHFNTSAEHKKIYGIETAKISNEEKEKLNGIIEESIKAQMEYYSTKKVESLEKAKDLYLPEAFEQYKEYVKQEAGLYDAESGNQAYDKIKTKKFSLPRIYKVLSDRIGIISVIRFTDEQTNSIIQISILRNNNGEWKIEKQSEIDFQTEWTESYLIDQIIDSQK